jgi:hypothetical protein
MNGQADYDLMPTLDLGGVLNTRPTRIVLGNKLLCAASAGSCLSSSAGFDGLLQEVRIWNTVRSLTEITTSKDHALDTPYPSSLVLYWKLNEMETSRTLTDAAKANTATLNLPMWKNNLIAPPFPTLEEVNSKVNALKSQMAELMDFIKDTLEPPQPTAAVAQTGTGFAVKDESKCDRRYKYQCKFTTQKSGSAASASAAASSAASNAAIMLVQRGTPELSELLEPSVHHHTQKQLQKQPEDSDNTLSSFSLSNDDDGSLQRRDEADLIETDQSAFVSSAASIAPELAAENVAESNTASFESGARRRHAWATPRDVTSTYAQGHTVSSSSFPTRSFDDVELSQRRGGRHAWATGLQRKAVAVAPRLDAANADEF